MTWTAERVSELLKLQDMVFAASCLNTANGTLDRLGEMETTARELLRAESGALEPSFMEFLHGLCLDARTEAAKRSQQ